MPQNDKITGAAVSAVVPERLQFKELLLGNPNYFGNFPHFGGAVVKPISTNTEYEHLACVGLSPGGFFGTGLLEAVINISQHSGYGSNACGAGSIEYVRFFVQQGTAWHDLGAASVHVFDLASTLPLSYAVSVDFNEPRKFCTTENIMNVRAILSWQWEPPAGDADFKPVWGNVIEAQVQVAPALLFSASIDKLIADKALTIHPELLKSVDQNQTLPLQPPAALSFAELGALYANANVPAHRFGFKQAMTLSSQPLGRLLSQGAAALKVDAKPAPNLADFSQEASAILAALAAIKGNTTFEELVCAGYNPQSRELEAVVKIKKNAGYSGSLCTHGSTEYVSFYGFFNGIWNALGNTQVQVHDLAAITANSALSYAVFRLSNLTSMPCEKLESIPLRAILSWEVPATGAAFIPVWGNVVDTHVQPQIAAADGEEGRIMRIGQVTISNIDASGLAIAAGSNYVSGDCHGNQSPFGGEIIVEGDFMPRLDVFNHTTGALLPGAKPILYQVWVTPQGGSPSQLLNSFSLALFPPDASVPTVQAQTAAAAPGPVTGLLPTDKFYTYYESDLQAVNPRTLAVFEAGGLAEGKYTLQVRGFKWNGSAYAAIASSSAMSRLIYIYNGYPHMEETVGGTLVPEQRPAVNLTITSPSGDCGEVQVGDVITGSFQVVDHFFSSVSVAMVPVTVGGVPQPSPTVVLTPDATHPVIFTPADPASTFGTSGTFTLDTTGMTPCGYTIQLWAWDRALVSNSCYGHQNSEAVGFCLRAKS